jgi:DNA helicase HerA-like ATPase
MGYSDQPYDLDQIFARGRDSFLANPDDFRLGVIVGGSLSKGLTVKLDIGVPIETLAVGRYVVVRGQKKRFFCMITDVVLDNTNPDIQSAPPDFSDPFMAAVYGGTAAYGKISVQPLLSIDSEGEDAGKPKPVKTIPGHFMEVYDATAGDVNAVFGPEDATHFHVGSPLELDATQINLDLKALVQRSIGVFGKSGTGKSFLTRLLLAGVIAKKQAVALIFDMHNDYGWAASDERGVQAKGLRQLLGADQVVVYSLDPESTARRGGKSDFDVQIGYDEIEPEDLESLRVTMNLSDAMLDAARMLRKEWGARWVAKLIDAGAAEFDAIEEGGSPHRAGTLAALQRRLQRFERWYFLARDGANDSVAQIMHAIENGRSVVLEFGRWGNSLEAYMLVANYLTRRIHELYIERVEKALGDKAHEPPQLLIVIEEAHKFLDPKIANQTTFGIIARELRKYKVTLLVVDQRPSGIDEEVMSQIGTRVTALLDNERDITAVLMGVSGAAGLREVLSRLDTKQQVIIMGHAVPMPVVVRTRAYDDAFYAAMQRLTGGYATPAPIKPADRRIR